MDIMHTVINSDKKTIIYFNAGNTGDTHRIEFNGKHLPELEKPNWHYYQTDDGYMIHCRKEHMVCVIEKV